MKPWERPQASHAATIATDKQWKSSDKKEPGWEKPDYNDAAWKPAREVAAFGEGVWGNAVGAPLSSCR